MTCTPMADALFQEMQNYIFFYMKSKETVLEPWTTYVKAAQAQPVKVYRLVSSAERKQEWREISIDSATVPFYLMTKRLPEYSCWLHQYFFDMPMRETGYYFGTVKSMYTVHPLTTFVPTDIKPTHSHTLCWQIPPWPLIFSTLSHMACSASSLCKVAAGVRLKPETFDSIVIACHAQHTNVFKRMGQIREMKTKQDAK